jgi:hypothetical protein
MIGFIFMVDEFRPDNGATRSLSGFSPVVHNSRSRYGRSYVK